MRRTSKLIKRLERVLRSTVRFVVGLRKRDPVQEEMKRLHLLPAEQRIKFKLACLGHKITTGETPNYLQDLIIMECPSLRRLRSATDLPKMRVPVVKTTKEERRFAFQVPKVFNGLPLHLRAETSTTRFKKNLKTWLFKESYGENRLESHPTDFLIYAP